MADEQTIVAPPQGGGNGPGLTLEQPDRERLAGIVGKMQSNGESDENIRTAVSAFKQKYGKMPSPMGPSQSDVKTAVDLINQGMPTTPAMDVSKNPASKPFAEWEQTGNQYVAAASNLNNTNHPALMSAGEGGYVDPKYLNPIHDKLQQQVNSLKPQLQQQELSAEGTVKDIAGDVLKKAKDFYDGDQLDYGKVHDYALEQARAYGGDRYVAENIYNRLTSSLQAQHFKPEADAEFQKMTGLKPNEYFEHSDPQTAGKLKDLSLQFQHDYEGEARRSQDIINQKAQTIFDAKYKPQLEQVVQTYGQDSQQAQDAYADIKTKMAADLRAVQIQENARLNRMRDEKNRAFQAQAGKLTSDINPLEMAQYNQLYNQAFQAVQQRHQNAKAEPLPGDTNPVLSSFLRSAWSSVNSWMASRGAGLVGMGFNNPLTDFMRSRQTAAESTDAPDAPLSGLNLLNPLTYATRAGKMVGGVAPDLAVSMLAKSPITGGLEFTASSTLSGMGDVYNQAKAEGLDEAEAQKRAQDFASKNFWATLPANLIMSSAMLANLKGTGGFIANTAKEGAGGLGAALPQQYLQQAESQNAKTLGEFMQQDAPKAALENLVGLAAGAPFLRAIGHLSSAMSDARVNSAVSQHYSDIIDKQGIPAAYATAELQYMNGVLDESGLATTKAMIDQLAASKSGLNELGAHSDQHKLYLDTKEDIDRLKEQSANVSDETLKGILDQKVKEKEGFAQEVIDGKAPSIKFTGVNGGVDFQLPLDKAMTMLDEPELQAAIRSGEVQAVPSGAEKDLKPFMDKLQDLQPPVPEPHTIDVRHAVTPEDDRGVTSGPTDIALNDKGRGMAGQLADDLEGRGITRVISSGLPRSVETADIVADQLGVPRETHAGLNSWDIGEFDKTKDTDFKEAERYFVEHPDKVEYKGRRLGESFRQYQERVSADRQGIEDEDQPGTLVVNHGGNINIWDAVQRNGEWNEQAANDYLNAPDLAPATLREMQPEAVQGSTALQKRALAEHGEEAARQVVEDVKNASGADLAQLLIEQANKNERSTSQTRPAAGDVEAGTSEGQRVRPVRPGDAAETGVGETLAANGPVPPGESNAGAVRTPGAAEGDKPVQDEERAATPVESFTTSKGSTYRVGEDGVTTRNKALRPEHPGDEGPQPTSEKTYYVTKDELDRLSEVTTSGSNKMLAETADGKLGVKYADGKDAVKFERRTLVNPKTEPAVGLHPVEVWKGGREYHFGNEITSVQRRAEEKPIDTAEDFERELRGLLDRGGAAQEQLSAKGDKMDRLAKPVDVGGKSNTLDQYITKAKAVLGQLFPDHNIKTYDTEKEYTEAEGRSAGSAGVYDRNGKYIALNLERIRAAGAENTVFHEVIHPIVLEALESHAGAVDSAYSKLVEMKDVPGMEKVWEHEEAYRGRGLDTMKVEAITEFLTHVADGRIDPEKFKTSVRTKIIDTVNKIFKALGIDKVISTAQDIRRLADTIKEAFQTADASGVEQALGRRTESDGDKMDALKPTDEETKMRSLLSRASDKISDEDISNTIQRVAGWDKQRADTFINDHRLSYEARATSIEEVKDEYFKKEGDWLGRKDLNRVNSKVEAAQTQKDIKASVDKVQKAAGVSGNDIDKAIHLYLDAQRNPGDFDKYYDQLSPDQKKIADLSQHLNDTQKKIADGIRKQYDELGKQAVNEGLIKDALENYVGRAWDMGGKPATEQNFKFNTSSKHQLQRSLDTILQGYAQGMKLKIEGASNNLQVLKEEIGNVLENKRHLEQGLALKIDTGEKDENGKPIKSTLFSTSPQEGYVRIDSPAFKKWEFAGKLDDYSADEAKALGRRKDILVGEKGSVMKKSDVYAPKEVAESLNNILGSSKLPFQSLIRFGAAVKQSILSFSGFHFIAFTRAHELSGKFNAVTDVNPVIAYKGGLRMLAEQHPIGQELIKAGMTVNHSQSWLEGIDEHQSWLSKQLDKTAFTKAPKDALLGFNHKMHEFLFGSYGAGLKMFDGINLAKNEFIKNPNADPAEVYARVSKLMNDTYGGINWDRMPGSKMQNPTTNQLSRMLLLAPDWTSSNLRFAKNAFKTNQEGVLYRKMWGRVLLRGAVLTTAANAIMSYWDQKDDNGNDISWVQAMERRYQKGWDAGKLRSFMVDITPLYHWAHGDPNKRAYFSIFGAYTDPITMMKSPAEFIEHKGSFLTKAALEAATGQNWQGRQFTTIDELLGLNDNGDKLKGEMTKNPKGGAHPIAWDQIPSFLLSEARGMLPSGAQNIWQIANGENDATTGILNSVGSGVLISKDQPVMNSMQRKIMDIASQSGGHDGPDDPVKQAARKQLRTFLNKGGSYTDAPDDIKAKAGIKPQEIGQFIRDAKLDPFVRTFKYLPPEARVKLFNQMSDEDKEKYGRYVSASLRATQPR